MTQWMEYMQYIMQRTNNIAESEADPISMIKTVVIRPTKKSIKSFNPKLTVRTYREAKESMRKTSHVADFVGSNDITGKNDRKINLS